MKRRRRLNQVSVRAFYEPRWAPAHSRDTTLQPDRPARGGGLVSCEQVGDYQPHLVAWLVKFSSLNVGCLVSLSVTWKVVGLVSSGRTYPLLVGWLISQLVSRLVTWLLLGE